MYSFKTERDTVFCKPQYYVPDDCYSISASIFVIDRETNGSVPLQFLISDSGAGDFGGESIVLDTVTDFTRIVGDQLATTVVASYTLLVAITRSKRTREITYFIFSVNWLLSVCSIITTAFIFRRREKLRDAVALIPLTLILTIPTIRGLYPGNPPFGVYIGTHRRYIASPELTLPVRPGGLLSSNAIRVALHCGNVVWFCGAVQQQGEA